jgi:3-hydroxyacyl-CoA dehydrogenase
VRTVAVIGADEEAASVAKCLADSGLAVTLLGATPEYPETAVASIPKQAAVEQRFTRVRLGRDYDDVEEADLVLPLVTRELLPEALAKLDARCRPDAIFAVGAAHVNIHEVALSTQSPERVLGIHFTGQRLMEVVSTPETEPTACATMMKVGRSLGRMPVLELADHAGARLNEAYFREVCFLLEEGAPPAEVDRVLRDFGFLPGPFEARERAPLLEPSRRQSIVRRDLEDREILERCLYAIVNEGAHLLHEGVLTRALEVDMLVIHGQGFPVYRGGPMYHADQLGLGLVYAGILRYASHANDDHWRPSELLAKLAEEGRGFYA